MMQGKPIRVFLIDDHPVTRGGLVFLIDRQPDMKVVGEASGCTDAQMKFQPRLCDVVILDITLGDGSGLDLISELLQRSARIPILVYSMHDELAFGPQAFHAGAKGYVMKSDSPEKLLEGIRLLAGGEHALSPALQKIMLKSALQPEPETSGDSIFQKLTPRELEVFRMIGLGVPPKKIAETIRLSIKTIHAHIENIKKRLGITSRIHLLQQAALWVEKQNP